MSEQSASQNKMGTMPIGKLLVSMSLPMIISMLVQAMYNIIDSIFVAQINEEALTAVSLAFPLQSLMIAVSAGTCVGVNALLSRSLGERNQEAADKTAVTGLFLAVLSFLVFALFGLIGSRFFFKCQTSNQTIIDYGTSYLTICCTFSFGIFLEMMNERLLQSTGRTVYSMIAQTTGAITNIILDPILIFGLLGAPKMGIAGAAAATVTGQILAMALAFYFNFTRNPDIHIRIRGFRPDRHIIKTIYQVGVPSIIMQSISSVTTLGMNSILMRFSETAVSVYGVYFKLQSFVFMPLFGLNNGLIPIAAYNYGARQSKRILDTIRIGAGIAVAIMTTGLLIFQIFPAQLLSMFNASDTMLEIGIPAMRIISICFPFAGFCIVCGSVFQALGNGMYSLIVSAARQLVCLLPLAYAFSRIFGLHAVWYSLPLAEITSLTLSILLLRRIYVEKIKPLDA